MAFMRVFGAKLQLILSRNRHNISRGRRARRPRPDGDAARATADGDVSRALSLSPRACLCAVTCLSRVSRGLAGIPGADGAERVRRERPHTAHTARVVQQAPRGLRHPAGRSSLRAYPLCTDVFGSLSRKMRLPAKCQQSSRASYY